MIDRETGSLSIERLESAEAFEQLRAIWQTLERLDPQCTPFNTWTWNSLWWQHYATSRDRLVLLIVREERRVVAIAPLFLHATRMGRVVPVTVLRFLGSSGDASADYLGIVALPDKRAAAEEALLHYLPAIRGWQKLLLSDVPDPSSLARRARKFVAEQSGVTLTPFYHVIPKAVLPDTFEDYCAHLSGKNREEIQHRQNCLDAAGTCELSICASNEELAEASDALVALHRERWQSEPERGDFRSVACEQFHRALIRQFFVADALWLVTLRLDGKIIGVQYIVIWRGELLFVQSGYSLEHEHLSPAHVLFTYAIQRGIEQGMIGLNMLKGHHADKSAYARDESRTVDMAFLRPGVRGLLGALRERLGRQRNKSSIRA